MPRKFFPRTALELLEHMEKRFQEPTFDGRTPEGEMRFSAGQRSVVTQMRREYELATGKDHDPSVFD